MDRAALENEWMRLTREALPKAAKTRDWPVSLDHCFQRICLDHACGGRWYDHISDRPAYKAAGDDILQAAVDLAQDILADEVDLHALNRQSLKWRGKLG
ncbi:GCN5-related N-acetyltransferase [Marivita hallyeonensis]|uniref:GCN5-related N-acetyltransferase n=1 Tax=Marivita hallyeonensis TaxID=996342 RepID=A0A1M5RD82_9RHOB|nr:GCN5-related N-acetyltransferase [Marivita hallyeonensis]SHH24100.1 hypothetical protein SAMN05443551_1710 [Marivita hallyeonensis]